MTFPKKTWGTAGSYYKKQGRQSKKMCNPYKPIRLGKVVSDVKQIKRKLAEREIKYYDLAPSAATPIPLFASATLIPFTGVPQSAGNSTDTTRIGDKIVVTNLWFEAFLLTSTNTTNVRFTVIQWMPNDTVAPTIGNIFAYPTTANGNVSPFVVDNRSLFRVLMDKKFSMNATTANHKYVRIRKRLRKKISYTAGSVNGVGNLYYVFGADATGVTFDRCIRIHFDDS
nr:MAG: capsid protein [Cressdnaviricota sp.]